MKNLTDIPECSKLIDEMLKKFDELPPAVGRDSNQMEMNKIKAEYFPKIEKAKLDYKKLHPEEFE